MRITPQKVFTVTALFFCLTAFGQRKADKQYEIKAYNLAIDSYIEYLNRNPTDGEAMARLADSYRHLNMMQEAAEAYERAVQQLNINPIHYLNYGKVLKTLEEYDKAKRWFLTYAKTNPAVGNHFAQTVDYATRVRNATPNYQVTNEQAVNTPASEFGPAFYQNDRLVFSSSRTDANPTDFSGKTTNQLFVAQRGVNGALQSLRLLQNDGKSSRASEGPISYSADGRTVAITHNNFVDGTRHLSSSGIELSLYLSDVRPDGNWGTEQSYPYNSSDYSSGFPHLAADGNTLYFASNRPDGYGGFDIYVSYRTGSNWSTPENLGPAVNTPGDEITPYFDGRTLYFASDWHSGLGGYDVFSVERQNSQWGVVTNLGTGINTSWDDYGFIFDNIRNQGYFVSNRPDAMGAEDIYRFTKSSDQMLIRVVNATDRQPVANAIIDFTDCGQGLYQTDVAGVYSFKISTTMNCRISVRKPGYISRTVALNAAELQGTDNYEVILSREDEGYSGYLIDAQSQAPLENVAVQVINQTTGQTVEVTTDQAGEYVVGLSANTLYDIVYSKPGYSEARRSIPIGVGTDKAILGVYPLQRSADYPYVNEPVSSTPKTDESGQPYLGSLPAVGYAVQVAAVEKLDPKQYSNLSSFGNIYYATVSGVYKVRIGVFPTREEALTTLDNVKKKGYKGAFLVKEDARDVADKFVGLEKDLQPKGNTTTTTTTSPTTAAPGSYKVRLAAYKDTKNFDVAKVNNIGTLERQQKGEWTIMLVGNYSSAEEARQALQRSKAAGFTDAYIVTIEQNGELRRINL